MLNCLLLMYGYYFDFNSPNLRLAVFRFYNWVSKYSMSKIKDVYRSDD